MITLLLGNDRYLIQQEIEAIQNDLKKRQLTFEVEMFDASQSSFDSSDFFHATRSISFLSDTKLIILSNYSGLSSSNKLSSDEERELDQLLSHQSDVNVIIQLSDKLDSRKKIVKKFQSETKVVDVSTVSNENAQLSQFMKKYNVKMDRETASYFLKVIDHKVERMDNELAKLGLYQQEITIEVIDLLVEASSDFLFYASELADALMMQQKMKLFEVYQELIQQRKKPIEIISTVAKSIRQVYQFNILYQERLSIDEIAASIGISPKQAYRYKNVHLYRDPFPLLQYLNDLSTLDQKFKLGLIDSQQGFELFLVKAVNEWNH